MQCNALYCCRNSVRPSICPSNACIVTKLNKHCAYFDTIGKGNHSSFLTPTLFGGQCPLPCEIFAKSDLPLRKTLTSQHRHILCRASLAYNNCQQLHKKLFGRRPSTSQPHGLSAIVSYLLLLAHKETQMYQAILSLRFHF